MGRSLSASGSDRPIGAMTSRARLRHGLRPPDPAGTAAVAGDLPRRTAQRVPDKLAIVDGDKRLTFAELDASVDRAAAALAAAGLGKGDRLALLCHNCWQFAVLDFATARAGRGAGAGQLHARRRRDRVHPRPQRRDGLRGGGCPVSTPPSGRWRPRWRVRRRARASASRRPTAPDGWPDAQDVVRPRRHAPDLLVADDDPVRMMFTSGTESRPKGALLSSRSLLWQYVSCASTAG